MTKSEIGQWVTAATNIAVLFGVVLLVIELQQNEELARLEMVQSRATAFQQAELGFFDPEVSRVWVKSIKEPASMTLEEIRMMDAYIAIHMAQLTRIYDLERAGLLEQGTTLDWFRGDFEYLFGNRFGQAWFEEFGQSGPSDFVELARPIVESVGVDRLNERFSRLQRALQAEMRDD
jgi:hypothetical protein